MVKDSAKEELRELFSHSPVLTPLQKEVQSRVLGGLNELLCTKTVKAPTCDESLKAKFRLNGGNGQSVPTLSYIEQLLCEVVQNSINMSSPRCMGHMTGPLPSFVRPLGELVVLLNQNMVKTEASRAFTMLERQTIAAIHRLIYNFSEEFYARHVQSEASNLGIMTSGGTLANITALWIARNSLLGATEGFAGVEEAGMADALAHHGHQGAVVLASRLTHYSMKKAVCLLGMGARSLIEIPTDRRNRMDISELRRALAECRARGQLVVAVVAAAGTTDCGSIDPLTEVADIAQEHEIHFHVDAAWGAPLLFSRRHQHALSGIERADSVTVDGHKQMYLPLGSSLLLLRSPQAAHVIEKHAQYILREDSADLGKCSLEGSRGAGALFLHAALHIIGQRGYELLVDENIHKAQTLAGHIRRRPEFELLAEPETNIILYRYVPPALREKRVCGRLSEEDNAQISNLNERLQREQYEAGRTFVSRTTFVNSACYNGTPLTALRAVVHNPLAEEEDLLSVLEDQSRIAAQLV
ncbi:MAG TPA: pyridoxal-dependent decarboxylase [Pyrinomonadaceae bacterium]|nr:pyridoxal-dependent decarboxylase [Pyrinomonadaceae bacterium]